MAALTGCSGGLTAAGVAAEAEHDSGGEQQGQGHGDEAEAGDEEADPGGAEAG
jgi:hypothetical protein